MSTPTNLTALAQADLLLLAARLLTPLPAGAATEMAWTAPAARGRDAAGRAEEIDPAVGWDLATRAGIGTGQVVVCTLDQIKSTPAGSLRSEQCRLFEAAGQCPPNETVYLRRDKGAILADICGFYRAFGFDHDPASGEKADHIACELEFVALLIVMRVRAAMEAEAERAAVCTDALATFTADHLGEWLPAFCEGLQGTAELPLMQNLAVWLPLVWQAVIRHHDLPIPACAEALGAIPDRGDPYECGRPDSIPARETS